MCALAGNQKCPVLEASASRRVAGGRSNERSLLSEVYDTDAAEDVLDLERTFVLACSPLASARLAGFEAIHSKLGLLPDSAPRCQRPERRTTALTMNSIPNAGITIEWRGPISCARKP